MAQRYSKPQIAESYKALYDPKRYKAVDHLFNWMDEEAMNLLKKSKKAGMEEAYALVNQANGIIKVKEHIESLIKVANPNE